MQAIILAGGKGTRMKRNIPKCAVSLKNKPMIWYLFETLKKIKIENIFVVVGYQKDVMIKVIKDECSVDFVYIEQNEQLGTGHAVRCCKEQMCHLTGDTLILLGDMPLIPEKILKDFISYHQTNKNDLTILTTTMNNPIGYGRILKDRNKIVRIVEETETNYVEKQIKEVNTGIYCIDNAVLFDNIDKIKNDNFKKEYYLTDLIEIMADKYHIEDYLVEEDYHLQGINDLKTLEIMEKKMEE